MASTEPIKENLSQRKSGKLYTAHLESQARVEFKDISSLVQKYVTDSGVQSGMCYRFVPHTTAAILINENDDPALQKDLGNFLKSLAPRDGSYHHDDGNCDAHLKAAVFGNSKWLFVEDGRLVLGRWQGIFLCEFDGPRRRDLRVKVLPD
jgi:secondary thiamine-phosphate synthase enzyme